MTTVLMFGTFDKLHPGHMACLSEAKALADELVVAVAPDTIVEQLKHRSAENTLAERIAELEKLEIVKTVLVGDSQLGAYKCFKQLKPDIVAFGYDQHDLAQDFQRFQQATGDETPTIVLKPYKPETFKSSLLRG